MKPSKDLSKKAPSAQPADGKQSHLQPQTGTTANRDKVREQVPVRAPRQSQRLVERSK